MREPQLVQDLKLTPLVPDGFKPRHLVQSWRIERGFQGRGGPAGIVREGEMFLKTVALLQLSRERGIPSERLQI
jgi:hypothetical protein